MKRSAALALLVAAAAVVTAVVAGLSTGWAWLPSLLQWLDGFVKSPGFGALAAVVAAGIAYRAGIGRIAHDREIDDQHRKDALDAANDQRWWEVLMWVYENVDTADPAKLLRICRALQAEAHTDAQRAMLGAIVDEALDQRESGE